MCKIDIISGFLGAGKTTLIKKLLTDTYHNEQLVLIENEFGEIGIDGGFLKEAGVEIKEMNSGCICCSLVGDFSKALQNVVDQFHPDRILIEPSGVGKLSDVIKAIEDLHNSEFQIDSLTTVVDANKFAIYMKNFKEFFRNQITYANTIMLSRSQLVSDEKLKIVVEEIKILNPDASIVSTPWDDLQASQLYDVMHQTQSFEERLRKEIKPEETCACGHHHKGECDHHEHHEHYHHDGEACSCDHEHHHDHHHAEDVFTSWGRETIHTYEQEQLQSILDELANTENYGNILRAKGILMNTNKEWLYFDVIPGSMDIRKGNPDTIGKLCVIGTDLKEEELENAFKLSR